MSPSDDADAAANAAGAIVKNPALTIAPGTILGLAPSQLVSIIGSIAGAAAMVAGGPVTVAGLSFAQLTSIGIGVANEIPSAVAAFEEIKALVDSGGKPTDAQWASWNAAADEVTDLARAAEDKVIAAG